MSNIRVTYAGLIAFIVGIISVITGLVFTLIVTRRLEPEEFGIWSIIGSMISYFLITEAIISYWSTRQIARGENVGKTAILTSITFSIGSIPIYLVLVFVMSDINPLYLNSMILATILLPLNLITQTLAAINLAHRPQANSYSLLTFESLKIPAGLSLVYFLDLGIDGALITIMIALITKIGVQVYLGKSKLVGKYNVKVVVQWIKSSWIPIYRGIGGLVWKLDVIIYPLITGSIVGVAFYAVSISISNLIAHSGLVSQAVYPKLLGAGSHEYAKENFTLLLYFAIPLLGISILFAKPALFALNPAYQDASLIVIIIALRTFFYVLSGVLHKILIGIEKIDEKKIPNFRSLLKSKLFLSPTLKNIHWGSYAILLVFLLLFLTQDDLSDLELVTWWAVLALSLELIFFVVILTIVKKNVDFSFPFMNTIKYCGITGILAFVYILTSDFIITYPISIFDFLPGVIIQLGICVSIYLGLTFLIDKRTKILFISILKEIKSKRKNNY